MKFNLLMIENSIIPVRGKETHEGCAQKKNEDSYKTFKIGPGRWNDDPNRSIYVGIVADGVTSTSGGAQASEIAVNTLERLLTKEALSPHDPANTIQEKVEEAIHKTNRQILEKARQNPEWGKMSTTLVAAVIADQRLMVAHLGDSRAYLVRGQNIYRLTLDHTWGQEALDKGLITQHELSGHTNRHVIRRFLGIKSTIDVDWQMIHPASQVADVKQRELTQTIDLQKDDVVLLCSDGLTDKVQEGELFEVLSRQKGRPQAAAKEMVQLALSKKETDNITVLLLSLADERKPAVVLPLQKIATAMVAVLGLLLIGWLLYSLSMPTPSSVANVPAVTTTDNGGAPITANGETSEPTSTTETGSAAEPTGGLIDVTETSATVSTDDAKRIASADGATPPTPTRRATATETPLPTATPLPTTTPLPTATLIPTATAIPAETATPIPAATVVTAATIAPAAPTIQPTNAAPLRDTPTPIVTFETPAPTVEPPTILPPAGQPRSGIGSVQLTQPQDDDSGKEMGFCWTPSAGFNLQPNEAYELIFWKQGEDPAISGLGVVGSSKEPCRTVTRKDVESVGLPINTDLEWAVRRVISSPKYEPKERLSEIRTFRFDGRSSGNSSSTEPTPICQGEACRNDG